MLSQVIQSFSSRHNSLPKLYFIKSSNLAQVKSHTLQVILYKITYKTLSSELMLSCCIFTLSVTAYITNITHDNIQNDISSGFDNTKEFLSHLYNSYSTGYKNTGYYLKLALKQNALLKKTWKNDAGFYRCCDSNLNPMPYLNIQFSNHRNVTCSTTVPNSS